MIDAVSKVRSISQKSPYHGRVCHITGALTSSRWSVEGNADFVLGLGHYLKLAVSNFPDDLRQLAVAVIADIHLVAGRDKIQVYVNALPDLPLVAPESYSGVTGMGKIHNEKLACSKRQSKYTQFLDKYLGRCSRASKGLSRMLSKERVHVDTA